MFSLITHWYEWEKCVKCDGGEIIAITSLSFYLSICLSVIHYMAKSTWTPQSTWWYGLGPFVSVKGNLDVAANYDTLDSSVLPSLWQQFRVSHFLFQRDIAPVHKARFIKTSGVEKTRLTRNKPTLQHHASSSGGRLYFSTSVSDFITAFVCGG